jgi:hypothetical protein
MGCIVTMFVIDEIPTKPLEECSICLEVMMHHSIEFLPCGHKFHAKCIHDWFNSPIQTKMGCQSCPMCNTDMILLA